MSVDELLAKIDRIIQRVDSEIVIEASKAGADMAALITNRVVQTGKSASGAPFTPYSTVPVPAFLYFGKSRSGAGEARVRAAAKKKQKISYRDFRVLNNLNPAPKNFEFTGEMWRGFGVTKTVKTPDGASVTIGGRTAASERKLDLNSRQEKKDIIEPSKTEIAIIDANLARWFENLVQSA